MAQQHAGAKEARNSTLLRGSQYALRTLVHAANAPIITPMLRLGAAYGASFAKIVSLIASVGVMPTNIKNVCKQNQATSSE